MHAQPRPHAKPAPLTSPLTPVSFGVLHRRCACGGTPGLEGERTECRKKRLAMQHHAAQQHATSNPF
jgi:hypothetical protein